MIVDQILDKMKKVQNNLFEYLEDKITIEDCFNVISTKKRISYDYLFLVLNLIAQIANNHYRCNNFINKIEQLIHFLKPQIKQNYSNLIIFKIFKYNKRILLFLIEEGILTIDIQIANKMMKYKYKQMFYPQYFLKEIIPFLSTFGKQLFYYDDNDYDDLINNFNGQLPENFEEKRKIGQNEDYICQLIQNDLIDDFIKYVNQSNYSLESYIKPSIYETNLLLHIRPTLIQYAAFYGSIKIFKYLLLNNVNLSPSLWFYAVHSNNAELIHILEEKKVEIDKIKYENIFIESVKSHHNDIANYILNNYIRNDDDTNIEKSSEILKCFNFSFIQSDFLDNSSFYSLCKYNYFPIVDGLLKTNKQIDINQIKNIENDETKTALFTAIEKNYYEIVKTLVLNEQIDVNFQNKMLTYNDYDNIFKTKWDDWPILNEYGEYISIVISPLFLAVNNENKEIVKLLLSNKNINVNQMSIFYRYSSERIHDFQVDNTRFEVNKNPLHLAIEKGNIEIVKLLLQCEKIDINSLKIYKTYGDDDECYSNWLKITEQTPLHVAIEQNNIEIINLLLKNNKIDVNLLQTKLNGTISFDDFEKWFDSDGSIYTNTRKNIDYFENKIEKMSELHLAILKENIQIIKLLLSNRKIDVNLRYEIINKDYRLKNHWKGENDNETVEKKTPLQIAIEKNNIKIINLLLAKKMINVNMTSYCSTSHCNFNDEEYKTLDDNDKEEEFSALHFAVSKGFMEIVKLLLDQETIDVNSKDQLGRKPVELTNNAGIKELFDNKK